MGGGFQRVSGAFVATVATSAALLLWLAVAASDQDSVGPSEGVLFGVWHVFYDVEVPAVAVLMAAVAVALLAAAGVAFVESRITTQARRAAGSRATPLAPKAVMRRTRGVFAGPVTVTVLIPAHNEEVSLPATLESLQAQSRPPERVIVVADNCSDSTMLVAEASGVEAVQTVENTHKKAGALNQVLKRLLPGLGDNDLVMVMDADTGLSERFLEVAVQRFTDDRALMAVGGLFRGEPGHGLIGQFQRNEYIRYERDIRRRRGRVFVLTGTASVFRSGALRTVAESRGRSIPGANGCVYDTAALTEDNELTIAIKSLGGLMISPRECTVVTELMPTWPMLWAQRLRWQRGALENLGAYGITRQTFRYWAQQFGIGYGVIALWSFLLMMLVMVLALDHWVWFPFWVGLGMVFMVERMVTAWKAGIRGRLLALPLLPEIFYDLFLEAVYVKGVLDISVGRSATWKHLQRAEAQASQAVPG
jgi:cellulose synthase/poly-beta-1,6-N-acetylglucosamine synthase-like glycosyltransferase